jgi:hypothetical protein
MTLTSLIALNAVLGIAVVCALVLLLGHGIRSDRRIRVALTGAARAPESVTDRLAA